MIAAGSTIAVLWRSEKREWQVNLEEKVALIASVMLATQWDTCGNRVNQNWKKKVLTRTECNLHPLFL